MNPAIESYADLARRDKSLPGLELLFDIERLAWILESFSGATVQRLKPVYMRYKRRTNCLVGYQVAGSMGETYVYGKAVRRGDSEKLGKDLSRSAIGTWLSGGPLVLSEIGLTVWPYPNDAKVRALRQIGDPDEARFLRRRFGDSQITVVPLSYKPERRFVAALRRAEQPHPEAVLRMYTRAGFDRAAVASHLVESRDVLEIPRKIDRNTRRHLLLFEWLRGRSLAELLTSQQSIAPPMSLVGRALGRDARSTGDREHSSDSVVQRSRRA